jgi:hypothetical protein
MQPVIKTTESYVTTEVKAHPDKFQVCPAKKSEFYILFELPK